MRQIGFHPHPHHDELWGGLMILLAFLFVVLLVVLATKFDGQITLPTPWNSDWLRATPAQPWLY